MNDLDVGGVFRVLVNLCQKGVVRLWPFLASDCSVTGWLAIAVPVTVRAVASVGRIDLSLLVLHNLVLVIRESLVGAEDWVVDCWWCPVRVVVAPGLLVLLNRSERRRVGWVVRWIDVVGIVGFTGGDDGIG